MSELNRLAIGQQHDVNLIQSEEPLSLRMNASILPSGDKAGDTAESVKFVICV